MNWYLQSGVDSDVIVSSRIRFARNLAGFPFQLKKQEDINALEKKIKDNLYGMGYGLQFFHLRDMDDITKMTLVEKNLITPQFALTKNENGSILINEEENICIMINEKDHLRLQVFASGLALENTLKLAIEIDQKLQEQLGYATSQKYGYLTSSPSDCGTGLRASVMVHLPGLLKTGNMMKIVDPMTKFGINIRGAYGEESESTGDMFQISNQVTLGITEKEIVDNLKIIIEKLREQERKARKFLTKDEIELEDQIKRSYGILKYGRKISSQEARRLISNLKLGTDLGIIDELTDFKVQKLYLYTKPANMQKMLGEQYDDIERDVKRAEVIHKILEEQ